MAIDKISSTTGMVLSTSSKESPIPIIYFDKIVLDTVEGADIASSVHMHIEIPLDGGILGIADEEIGRYLNVLLVRSQSESATSAHESGIPLSTIASPPTYDIVYNNSLYNLTDTSGQSLLGTNEVSQTSGGNKILNVYFEIRDLPTDPSHLSYFAQCSLDVDKLAASLGISSTTSLSDYMALDGPVSGEKVISSGKVNLTSFIYQVTSQDPKSLAGTFWSGPVLQDQNGSYESAEWKNNGGILELAPTSPRLILKRIQTRNSKIQDFRIIKQMESYEINLMPDNLMPITVKGLDTYNNSIENPDAYVSNAFLSRDMEGNCRFMFEFDYDKFITKESKFGKILTNPFVPETSKQKIYYHSRITSLQIIRRQVEAVRGYNRLASPILGLYKSELDPEIQIVGETSSDQDRNNALDLRSIYNPGAPCARGAFLDTSGPPSALVGTVGEIFKIKGSPKTTKTIMATDNSSKCLTDGSFQYGVRIEMEDGTVRFLNERLKNLQVVRDYLVGYNNILQTPQPSFDVVSTTGKQIGSVIEYYDKLLGSGLGLTTDESGNIELGTPISPERRRTSLALSIEALRREGGIPVSALGDTSIRLFPWVVAPTYFVDTMETISDFGYQPETKISPTTSTQNGIAAMNSLSSKPSTPENPSAGMGSKIIEEKFFDFFDEEAAYYAIESLLIPQSATSESALTVIRMFDTLEQKIRTMLGASIEEKLPNFGVSKGTPKNSKVSALNLEDYFVELYDAKLSKMPSIDYMGFANSPGRVVSIPPPATKYAPAPNTNTKQKDFTGQPKQRDPEKVAGFFQAELGQFQNRMKDEENLYEPSYVAELTNPEDTIPSDRDGDTRRQKINKIRERKKQQQEIYQETLRERKREDQTQASENPRERLTNDYENRPVQLSAALIYDGQNQMIERTENYIESWQQERYTQMQNIVVAKSAEFEPSRNTTDQDVTNFLMTQFGVTVGEVRTPLAAQENLEQGAQRRPSSDTGVRVGSVLGEDSGARYGNASSDRQNACLPGQGSSPEDLARCSNEAAANPVIQSLINIVATNGSLNSFAKKANGNPSTMAKMFSKLKTKQPASGANSRAMPRQFRNFPGVNETAAKMQGPAGHPTPRKGSGGGVLPDSNVSDATAGTRFMAFDSPYKSAMYKLSLDLLADVWMFNGYETDTSGNIMIKKPIWTNNPGVWATALEDLGRDDSEYQAILCAFRKIDDPANGIGLNSGLDFVETNTYFLLTKEGARLFDLSDVLEDLVIQYPFGNPNTKGGSYGFPPITQTSIKPAQSAGASAASSFQLPTGGSSGPGSGKL